MVLPNAGAFCCGDVAPKGEVTGAPDPVFPKLNIPAFPLFPPLGCATVPVPEGEPNGKRLCVAVADLVTDGVAPNGLVGDAAPKVEVAFAAPKRGGGCAVTLALLPVELPNLNCSDEFDVVLGPNEKLFCGTLGCNADADAVAPN